ncbi:PadR family transcriptional regulator [Litoribrevibacter albus]|uniref:PadR family transcriptional regulator n=1 Tax=Litoribrevibacter albus TaxID=1473156 RepID=A0AA37SCL8_9GAMM|nr:PadR family transcriptional regulator [Litoribrevibacter albus]GLQ32513.1 PadR family transcriptional regulator [Litoribrevibacter albus]
MSLKHSLLVLLADRPATGYELSQKYKEAIGFFWKASHQQIYKQLKDLADQGWVTFEEELQAGKPDKKKYQITSKGLAGLRAWLSSEIKPSKTNDALLVMLYGGKHVDDAVLLREVKRHQLLHQKNLQKLEAIESLYLSLDSTQKNSYRLPYLTLKRGLSSERAWLEWSDEVVEVLMAGSL